MRVESLQKYNSPVVLTVATNPNTQHITFKMPVSLLRQASVAILNQIDSIHGSRKDKKLIIDQLVEEHVLLPEFAPRLKTFLENRYPDTCEVCGQFYYD